MSLSPVMWERAASGVVPGREQVLAVARTQVGAFGSDTVDAVQRELSSRLLGAGPLQPCVELPGVTDVVLNGDGRVWVDRGRGMELTEVVIEGSAARALAVRLAAEAGRRLDDAAPWVDAQLTSGVRLHAVLPPLVDGAAHVTLRIPSPERLDLRTLVERGTVPPQWLPLLRGLVARRVAFLISGGTGAGKTTLLGSLLSHVPATERILVVEDVAEIRVDHPHCVRLQTRSANVEGVGEVGLATLVRQALRMRPDRLVLGEARGPEVRELLTALNTGHEGGCGTIHANSAADVPARVEALAALAGMDGAATGRQLGCAVEVLLHLRRLQGRTRILETISLIRTDGPTVDVLEAGRFDGEHVTPGPGWSQLVARCQVGGIGGDVS